MPVFAQLVWTLFLAILLGCTPSKDTSKKQDEDTLLSFADASSGLPVKGQWRHGLAFADMNGDGRLDILAPPARLAPAAEKKPVIWYAGDNNTWKKQFVNVSKDQNFDYGGIGVLQEPGEKEHEIALAMHGLGVHVLKKNPDGQYVESSRKGIPSWEQFTSRAIVTDDFNKDDIPDFAAVSEADFGRMYPLPTGIWVCLGSKDAWQCGPIGSEKEMKYLYADQLVTGDVNGDGNRDIAVASLQHLVDQVVWIGDGRGGFSPFSKGLPKKLHFDSVALADFNGDGRDDFVSSVTGFGKDGLISLKAFLSRKEGFEEISEGLPQKELYMAVGAGDLDGDGTPEIVGGTAEGGIKVFAMQNGRWQRRGVLGFPENGLNIMRNIYVIDMNNDGCKDIVLNYSQGDDNSGGIRVFLNESCVKKK